MRCRDLLSICPDRPRHPGLPDRASAPVFVDVAIFVAIVVAIPSGVALDEAVEASASGTLGQAGCAAPPSC
jgi:hypothetical protein